MQLSVIIPFLNEGEEVAATVRSLRETAAEDVAVILVNDGSDDGYDYKSVAEQYGCRYVEHRQRRGVAASRQEGVAVSETPYFLLLDAHMRFYDAGWDKTLVGHLESHPRAVLCCQTRILNKDEHGTVTEVNQDKTYCGGFIDFGIKEVFKVTWIHNDMEPYSKIVEIPCILGAGYACNKKYWQYLHGLDGLRNYGTDEEFLSLKVWLEGGRCLLIKDLAIGHIYRTEFPYVNVKPEVLFNRLLSAELMLPPELKAKMFDDLRLRMRGDFDRSYDLLKADYKQIRKEKEYLKSIFTKDMDFFVGINDRARNKALGYDPNVHKMPPIPELQQEAAGPVRK